MQSTAGADPDVRRGRGVLINRFVSSPLWSVPLGYLLALSLAESLTVLVEPRLGLTMHGIVLLALLLHGSRTQHARDRRFLLSLALAPLIRLLSMSLPLGGRPLIEWYSSIGMLLFVAAFLALRATGLGRDRVGLNLKGWPLQLSIGFVGLGLGLLEYYILKPEPLARELTLKAVWLPAVVLIVFTGLLEEIIFRGLIQQAAMQWLGRSGLVYVAVLFAVLHLGYRSVADVLFVFVVGLTFGLIVLHTGSILGVSLAHGLTNVSLYLIFPILLLPAETLPLPTGANAPLPAMPASPTGVLQVFSATTTPTRTTPTPTAIPPTPTLAVPTPSPQPTPEPILIDDGDPGFEAVDGSWWIEAKGFGGDLHWAFATAGEPDTVVHWRPRIEQCGEYEVEVYVPPDFGTTRAAMYEIGYGEDVEQAVLDQSVHPAAWALLGRYTFEAGEDVFLRLTNRTGEESWLYLLVVFDAARWTYVRGCSGQSPGPIPPGLPERCEVSEGTGIRRWYGEGGFERC